MAERGVKVIERNKEGTPSWDGDPVTFTEYSEMAGHWEQSVVHHKRYLCGPKLQAELTGTARRFVMSMKPGWCSHNGGVTTLLNHLRRHLGQPQLSEMSDYMARYFKNSKRRRNENMNDYITRKAELYRRACQTLDRVQSRYEPARVKKETDSNGSSRKTSRPGLTIEDLNTLDGAEETYEIDEHGYQDDHGPRRARSEAGSDPWEAWYGRNQWWNSSDWHSGEWDGWSWGNKTSEHQNDRITEEYVPPSDFLPSFVQGWFLLQDSGLEPGEKNMILAALKDNFSVDRVAQELRNQWADDDIRKRDLPGPRGSAYWMGEDPDDDDAGEAGPDLTLLAQSGVNEEGMSILQDAEEDAQEALAAIERSKRTLRDARAKQHFVKMSRQYYQRSSARPFNRPRAQPHREDGHPSGNLSCLACGGSHKTSACPKKTSSTSAHVVDAPEAEAPFVCYAQDAPSATLTSTSDEALLVNGLVTTREAVEQGKAIIDGGATRTLGSVQAVERVMALNQATKGHTGLHRVDGEDRPTFGFGNSSTNQCLSTAWLQIQAGGKSGQLKIHTLDQGASPILFSIETLRSLGAVVDYENDSVVFRQLDPSKVIKLERSCTGHQLLPLTDDWFQNSFKASEPVPPLKHYI